MNSSPNLYLVSVLEEINSALSKFDRDPTEISLFVPVLLDSIINDLILLLKNKYDKYSMNKAISFIIFISLINYLKLSSDCINKSNSLYFKILNLKLLFSQSLIERSF